MASVMIALSVTNTLLAALNHPLLKEAFLSFAYGNRLKKLKGTVTAVKSLLLNMASKAELEPTDLDYVVKLKDAVYDADDLFDELVTKAQRKQLFDDVNIVEKVRQLLPSVKTSLKVKKLRSRLKDIADDHSTFGLSISTEPYRAQPPETFSNLRETTIVGRDDNARLLIIMLLDSTTHAKFLTIVGIGGVGKTTLAKLVYGDERIKAVFDFTLWVSVSDHAGASLNEKDILVKILDLFDCKRDSKSSLESLHCEYQRKLEGKSLLLVLDDVWNENPVELENLKALLMIDDSVIRILATTRSMKMAKFVGDYIHELKGLSDDNSRHLFEMVAFRNESKAIYSVEIVEKIVKICSNIPLVIKVVGSLLYGQPISKWQAFLTSGFAEFAREENQIMAILKLSYDNLEPSLKSCFAYCALFPKDYYIGKDMLMNLWEAQGYIVPFKEGQSIEDAGKEHFSVLLQRCFFQDVINDHYGDVMSVRIHDLMHDLAQRVSGEEICMINFRMPNLKYNVRHLFVNRSLETNIPNSEYSLQRLLSTGSVNSDDFNRKCKIRSYLMYQQDWGFNLGDELPTFEMPTNWRYLRALALQKTNVTRLPDTFANLLHLRYLSLAHSKVKKLPDSIAKLINLQTLNINGCKSLEEWPKEFSKLVNLTHLYNEYCFKLSGMPVGMSKLSSIRTLTEFVVADESVSRTLCVGQLTDLKALAVNLKGRISIRFIENFKSTEGNDWEGSCLEGANLLNELSINFVDYKHKITPEDKEEGEKEEVMMENLKPHPNLIAFILRRYAGEKIAKWGRAGDNWAGTTFLPNLVRIELMGCHRLQELPRLSKLQLLKSLHLSDLENLEYMEEAMTSSSDSGESGPLDTTFFPSLQSLHVSGLKSLKRWWKSEDDSNEVYSLPAFPNLSELHVTNCHRLILFPLCLGRLRLYMANNNEELRIAVDDRG